jgi:hypothetical protein
MFARFEAEDSSRAFFEDDDEEECLADLNGLKLNRVVENADFENRIIPDSSGYKLYFLDDDSEDGDESIDRSGTSDIETYVGETYEAFIQANQKNPSKHLFCVFNGRVPIGFGKGYLDQSVVSLAKIYYTGNQGTVDSLLVRPKSKLVVEILKVKENLIFALLDTYAVPSSSVNAICAELKTFVETSRRVVVFDSQGLANFSSNPDNFTETKIFYIKNQHFEKHEIPTSAVRSPPSNLLAGISATILTQCQQIYKKPCLILVNYSATEIVNQVTLKPFFDAVCDGQSNTDISSQFGKLKFTMLSTGSSLPTYISQSNLFT